MMTGVGTSATNKKAKKYATVAKQWLLYKRQHWDAKKTRISCQLEEEL